MSDRPSARRRLLPIILSIHISSYPRNASNLRALARIHSPCVSILAAMSISPAAVSSLLTSCRSSQGLQPARFDAKKPQRGQLLLVRFPSRLCSSWCDSRSEHPPMVIGPDPQTGHWRAPRTTASPGPASLGFCIFRQGFRDVAHHQLINGPNLANQELTKTRFFDVNLDLAGFNYY